MLFCAPIAAAQQVDSTSAAAQRVDSAAVAPPDSLLPSLADSLTDARMPPVYEQPEDNGVRAAGSAASGGLQEAVTFAAQDSLVVVFGSEQGDVGTLYGSAKVDHSGAGLTAHKIEILFNRDELRASGLPSDTGMVGRPEFKQAEEAFVGDALAYNMRTERGRVVGARTRMDEGFIKGGVVKVTEDSTLFVQNGVYSTCECIDDPSYSLRSSKMKVVDKEWVYTGPIQLFLFNIPTPLWLPFGFLPAQEGRRSGPLPPTYGEDDRGFYLRDWGWYWAINDYFDAQVRGGIWSRGSWQVAPTVRYNRRYRYSGQLAIDYVRSKSGEAGDPDQVTVKSSSIRWNHNQEISPTSRFGANVDLSTQGYLRSVSESYNDRVTSQIGSSIRYSKSWPNAGRNMNVSLTHRQVVTTGQTDLTFPSLSFAQSTRTPLKRKRVVATDPAWYEQLSYSYSGSLDNRFSFPQLPDSVNVTWWEAITSPSKYRELTGRRDSPLQFRANHNVPVSLPFTLERLPLLGTPLRLNLPVNFNYAEEWYLQTDRRSIVDGRVQSEKVPGFFALRRFTGGASANTTIYGIFPYKVGAFSGFRHTVRPSLGLSFSPDFTAPFWGYTRTYRDTTTGRDVQYSIVSSSIPTRQQNLSIRLDNVFEGKLVHSDSTGEETSRVLQLLNMDLSTSYNMAADSFRLSSIYMGARTNLFDKYDLSANATFSPYAVEPATGRLLNRYVLAPFSGRFLRLTDVRFSAGTSFRSSGGGGGRPLTSSRLNPAASPLMPGGIPPYGQGGNEAFGSQYYNTPVGYADFAIPWSLNLDFSYSYTKGVGLYPSRSVSNLNARFDFSVTPNWKVQGQSGYDLVRRELVTTSLFVARDFECWQLSFSWYPFGQYQSYGFDLHVKSGKLRDLLRIRQPRDDVRGRFGSTLGGLAR